MCGSQADRKLGDGRYSGQVSLCVIWLSLGAKMGTHQKVMRFDPNTRRVSTWNAHYLIGTSDFQTRQLSLNQRGKGEETVLLDSRQKCYRACEGRWRTSKRSGRGVGLDRR